MGKKRKHKGEPAVPSPVLSTEEAAKYLGLSASYLHHWRLSGGGPPYVRVSRGRVVYRVADLDSFLAARIVIAAERDDKRDDDI